MSTSTSNDIVTERHDLDEELPGRWPHPDKNQTEGRLSSPSLSDLRDLLGRYVSRHLPPKSPPRKEPPAPPSSSGSYARLLPFLQLVPWLLAALFGFSFVWDFPDVVLTAFGQTLLLEGILRVVSVSGLIGFLTNWLAVTMLFQPREARPIFGQGLIPAQRERVIHRLAQAVSRDLINEAIIKEKIHESQIIARYRERTLQVTRSVLDDPSFRVDLKKLASDYLKTVLSSPEVQNRIATFTIDRVEYHARKGLSGLALKAYRFLNEDDFQRRIEDAVRELPSSVELITDEIDHTLDELPPLLERRATDIEDAATSAILRLVEHLDVYDMVATNMARFDESQLEDLLKKTSNEQLNYIKYLGGILGFFGGLVIWNAPLALSVFTVIGIILYLLDVALFRAAKTRQN